MSGLISRDHSPGGRATKAVGGTTGGTTGTTGTESSYSTSAGNDYSSSRFSESDSDSNDHLPRLHSSAHAAGASSSSSGRYTPDIFSGLSKTFKKIPNVSKLSRNPSLLNLKTTFRSESPVPPSFDRDIPTPATASAAFPPTVFPTATTPSGAATGAAAGTTTTTTTTTSGKTGTSNFNPSTGTFATTPQSHEHARKLSIQANNLDKPLPDTPARPSPVLEDTAERFERFCESRLDSRPSTMESSLSNQPSTGHHQYTQDMSGSISSLTGSTRHDGGATSGDEQNHGFGQSSRSNGTAAATAPSPGSGQGQAQGQGQSQTQTRPSGQQGSSHLSGLMCNVHRTTGREPHPLVGATTTVLGDKLYVFGGRILSKTRSAPLTSDMYELDLIRRHWTKLETTGDVPPPRYFHSMCALGDTKMVCYGGMSPIMNQQQTIDPNQPDVTVMSDIYIFDAPTRTWTYIPTQDPPQGRYAHCACVLPSSASFSSHRAPLSALQHNPQSASNPNEGRLGINIDGAGGSEMVIVGGQDGANHYIEQISVFNLRSLKWTSTQPLGKSCGAYRSVATPLPSSVTAKIGKHYQNGQQRHDQQDTRDPGPSMLIYSNYNFLDVKLELQIRTADGFLHERPMSGTYSPPGLRFPNGGILDTHFIVSGTYLTSSKQEYALWALDLRSLTWSRIDAGGTVFSQGSWNRGVLWSRRNTFVVLGSRKRSLVDDYNHRRINFKNVCMVEMEAFGFYDNPRKTSPLSGFVSASSPHCGPGLSLTRQAGYTAGGRQHSRASEELGEKALAMRELSDMDILCIGGERIPISSRIVARRWGPYFVQLLREGTATQDGSDSATLRSGGLASNPLRASAMTITPNNRNPSENSMALAAAASGSLTVPSAQGDDINPAAINTAPTPRSLPPSSRPRCLYLPHTYLTVQALLHFVYTSSLPAPSSPLCTPQILCSLLQIARPYRVDGLLEAVVERLHSLLDSRNAAAVFNATAMAAGGGRGIDGSLNPNFYIGNMDPIRSPTTTSDFSIGGTTAALNNGSTASLDKDLSGRATALRLDTASSGRPGSDELSASGSASESEWSSSEWEDREETRNGRSVWNGELSSVIGLQKRGLRGLMEGRRLRERTGVGAGGGAGGASGMAATAVPGPSYGQNPRVGLGIAGGGP